MLHNYSLSNSCNVLVKGGLMTEFKISCPECSAVVITAHPEAIIWERCPACRRHVWETNDLLMAEVIATRPRYGHAVTRIQRNS